MLKRRQNWGKIANYPPQCSTKICTTEPAVWFEVPEILPGAWWSSKKQFNPASSIISLMPLKKLDRLHFCLTKLW